MDGPKNNVAELTLVRRFSGARFGGESMRAAGPDGSRARRRGEPASIELVDEFELRRSRRVDTEGNATAPGVLPALRTGVGNPLSYHETG